MSLPDVSSYLRKILESVKPSFLLFSYKILKSIDFSISFSLSHICSSGSVSSLKVSFVENWVLFNYYFWVTSHFSFLACNRSCSMMLFPESKMTNWLKAFCFFNSLFFYKFYWVFKISSFFVFWFCFIFCMRFISGTFSFSGIQAF